MVTSRCKISAPASGSWHLGTHIYIVPESGPALKQRTGLLRDGWLARRIGNGGVVVETLVFIRHGEKPEAGLGLLTPKGQNRALKLPAFFAANFAPPDYLFAPNTAVKVTEIHGDGQRYDCVRELLTIGPTAVQLELPVNTQLPYNDSGLLADTLLAPQYQDAVIYLCWEHMVLVEFAKVMLRRFGNTDPVPEWDNADFDTFFVFTIDWTASRPNLTFEVGKQDLGPIPDEFPG